jgi:hypothetical protein
VREQAATAKPASLQDAMRNIMAHLHAEASLDPKEASRVLAAKSEHPKLLDPGHREAYRGFRLGSDEQFRGMFGRDPDPEGGVIELEEGRWIDPTGGRKDERIGASWSDDPKIASEFARSPFEGWSIVIVADTGENNFVGNPDEMYEYVYESNREAVRNTAETQAREIAEDEIEREDYDSPEEYERAVRKEMSLHVEDLMDELAAAFDYADERETMSVGPVRVKRVIYRPSGRTAAQMSEFRQEVEGKRFRNPETGNQVLFVSLPKNEQARIFAEWRRHQRGEEPRKERERGLVKIDHDDAKSHASHMADVIARWKVRDPDERIGDRFLPGMGRGAIFTGGVHVTDVRRRRTELPVYVRVGKPTKGLWRAGRHFVTGGQVPSMHYNEEDPGKPMMIRIELNPDVTYRQFAENRDSVEREIRSVLMHELTHAHDVLESPAQMKRLQKGYPVIEEADAAERVDVRKKFYYNMPSEVRAFKRQVAEEVRRAMERAYGDEDEPEWVPADAEAVMEMLERSPTWERVKHFLNPRNRRKFLETVASVVRKFKEERGGIVS